MNAADVPHNAASSDITGRWVLFATIAAASMAFISQFALNVALPAIQADLQASGADLLWIVNAYQLMLGALILVGGALGDRYGRKRIYITGIVLFSTASFVCGIAPSTELLIGARLVQGIGGALMVPGSLAIIAAHFDETRRGQAIGTWAAFTTTVTIFAPVLGGYLADVGLWRVVFFLNLPLAAAALWALLRHVPESRDDEAPERLDYLGAALITLGLAAVVYAATEIGRLGVSSLLDPLLPGLFLTGMAILVIFFLWQRRISNPIMPPQLFRSRTFTGANVLTLLLYGALGGALFFLPLNLVQVQKYEAAVAGMALLPLTLLLILMSRWAGGFVDRYGPRLPLTIGPVVVGFGFAALALPGITTGPDAYWTTYFPGAVLLGLGMGVTVAPLTTAVMGSVPQHSAGTASGINNTMSRASSVLAVAILGGIALLTFSANLANRTEALPLSVEAREMLMIQAEALAEATPPPMLDAATSASVDEAIKLAFVDMFRLIMLIAVVSCWLSALLAWLLIDDELGPKRHRKPTEQDTVQASSSA